MSAILNNQIQPVSETRLSRLGMTSVISHWLTAKPFVLSLYKCDTTRMVGRLFNSNAIYTSLLISLQTIPPGYMIKYSSSTSPSKYPANILSQPASPTYTYTAHFSLIPTYSYTAFISLIPYIYTSYIFPTYTYRAYILLINNKYLLSLHLINPHINIHILLLIYPPHIPTQLTSN